MLLIDEYIDVELDKVKLPKHLKQITDEMVEVFWPLVDLAEFKIILSQVHYSLGYIKRNLIDDYVIPVRICPYRYIDNGCGVRPTIIGYDESVYCSSNPIQRYGFG